MQRFVKELDCDLEDTISKDNLRKRDHKEIMLFN